MPGRLDEVATDFYAFGFAAYDAIFGYGVLAGAIPRPAKRPGT